MQLTVRPVRLDDAPAVVEVTSVLIENYEKGNGL
jgi:hypothetical protein